LAGAGVSFSLLGIQTARRNLSGLEFASGIPATVGGAVFMNAGANGRETCEALHEVSYVHADGRIQTFSRPELQFSYRHSPFQKMSGVIVSVLFRLVSQEGARLKQLQIVEHRMQTQPLREKSAGCIFRNPEGGMSAGALIDRCGLKGVQIGGAKVSEIHANFIVNVGGASSRDVEELISLIQSRVQERTGVFLRPEVRVIDGSL
ncbi:UDP-N-acetylmuramate dehydrogenase, partial [Candidatus Dojkabacteria bacterium]